MQLQTQLPLEKEAASITYESKLLLLGSCFSQHMGAQLQYYRFQSLQNPFGILFHPKAIENLLDRAIHEKEYVADDVFFANERWHCFEAHSDLSSTTAAELLQKLNVGLSKTRQRLQQATHIIITLGTAWAYEHKERNQIVANCHKIPQTAFSKQLLSIADVSKSLRNCVERVRSINDQAQFIFTVSPVRHLRDGFVENQRSKAHLVAAVHDTIQDGLLKEKTSYFPAYELMMDELRDYRFYAADMVHPNEVAIQYIWKKFTWAYNGPETRTTMERVAAVQKGLAHRPFNPNSAEHQQFVKSLEAKITYLQKKYAWMQFPGPSK